MRGCADWKATESDDGNGRGDEGVTHSVIWA